MFGSRGAKEQGGGAPVNQDQRGTEVQDKLGGSRHSSGGVLAAPVR